MLIARCLVVHASIIYYGYTQALTKMPKTEEDADSKLRKMMRGKADRADLWVSNAASHISSSSICRRAMDAATGVQCRVQRRHGSSPVSNGSEPGHDTKAQRRALHSARVE